jgi:hypothetical protein
MSSTTIESRIAALISAYADRAPVDVDPMAMARQSAAAAARGGWRWPGTTSVRQGMALALLVVAVAMSVAGGVLFAGADPFRRGPEDVFTSRTIVEPFVGLPPEGAIPSSPEAGELVLSFYARVDSIGRDVHGMWLYADGRLIWRRNLELGNDVERRSAFRGTVPTTAVIEQRFTPDGVRLLLAKVRESASPTWTSDVAPPGVFFGSLQLPPDDRIYTWTDPDLPGLLANPAWLPVDAWADRELSGYVPARYAACLMSSSVLGRLPIAARDLMLANGTKVVPAAATAVAPPLAGEGTGYGDVCYVVDTADARAIAGFLESAGIRGVHRYGLLGYPRHSDASPGPVDFDSSLIFFGVLPHGDAVEYRS